MFTFALVLALFVLADFVLEALENHFSTEELTEMGISLDGTLVLETR